MIWEQSRLLPHATWGFALKVEVYTIISCRNLHRKIVLLLMVITYSKGCSIHDRQVRQSVPRQPADLHTQAESGAYLRDSSRVPRWRPFIYYLNSHTPSSGQSRVYRVTQLRTDGVHCRESAGTGPVNLKVVTNGFCLLGGSPWTTTNMCMCVRAVILSILDVRIVDVPAGVTQEEGYTVFLHFPSAVHALIFIARRIQPSLSLLDREVEFCVLTN